MYRNLNVNMRRQFETNDIKNIAPRENIKLCEFKVGGRENIEYLSRKLIEFS